MNLAQQIDAELDRIGVRWGFWWHYAFRQNDGECYSQLWERHPRAKRLVEIIGEPERLIAILRTIPRMRLARFWKEMWRRGLVFLRVEGTDKPHVGKKPSARRLVRAIGRCGRQLPPTGATP